MLISSQPDGKRISEILDAAPGGRVASADGLQSPQRLTGFPLRVAPVPASRSRRYSWTGHVWRYRCSASRELEFVPLLLAQLDGVVVTTEPLIVGARIETSGVIQFYWHRSKPGVTWQNGRKQG